jgi:hypothetical protein
MRAEGRSEDKARRADILNSLSSMHLSSSFLMMVEEFEINLQDIVESGNGQPSQFETMLKRLGMSENASASIVTLQGVMGILRTMPDQAYPSLRALTQLRGAAQTVLESAILREEEATG